MKSLIQILGRVYHALEFANVGNLDSLNKMLDRHERRQSAAARPSRAEVPTPQVRVANVHYLNLSLPVH